MQKLIVAIITVFSPFLCEAYDILGIGSSCVDFVGFVDDDVLATLPGRKGDSTLVKWDSFKEILSVVPANKRMTLTGGCCSNTIKGLASLGHQTAFCGRIGVDPMSAYFTQVITRLGVTPCLTTSEKPIQQVVSWVTPDTQRTFWVYLGATEDFVPADVKREFFDGISLVYIEGYALHHPGVVQQAIAYAKEAGAKVAMDLASIRVVNMFRDEIFRLIENGVDIVFCNQDEIEAMTGQPPRDGAERLSMLAELAIVMVGKDGCWVGSDGKAVFCPGNSVDVVDTTGAGDLFAAGFLNGYLKGQPLEVCGAWGNLAGSCVVQQMGAEISPEKWCELNKLMQPMR